MVAIVSLGAPRAFLLRPRDCGPGCGRRSGTATCWSWAAAASAWEHAVPGMARAAGPRIIVQFCPGGVR